MKKDQLFLLCGFLGAALGGLAVFGATVDVESQVDFEAPVDSAAPVDFQAEGKLWWAHIQFLADDKLAGRNTGSAGYQKAVDHVAAAFERFGLQPLRGVLAAGAVRDPATGGRRVERGIGARR